MRTTEIIDNLAFGESTKKNVNKLNQLIDQVNNNTEHIVLADEKTIRKIQLDGEDRLATNMEVLTLDQFQTLINGQVVTLADGREIEFDSECIYYITDDNGDAILNNLYKRIDYGMIRGWANNMVCDETLDPVPTLKYLYAYAPVDGPVNGHPMYTCQITKLSDEFIEVEATDLYTGYNYVTVKKDGVWSDWVSSTPEYMCAKSDMVMYVSPDGDDLGGSGEHDSPFKTFETAINAFPPIRNGHNYCIKAKSGTYEGFSLNGFDFELGGYEDDTPGILTFTSEIRLLNGASLVADSDKMLSINFRIPTNGTGITIDKHSSLFINCNVVMSSEVDADNTTGIIASNGSVCTLYSALYATDVTTALKSTTSSRVFVDAITATSCGYAGVADRSAVIGFESARCNNMTHEFLGTHGGRIIRGNQVERKIVVGDNMGDGINRAYKIASLEMSTGSREVKTTFSIRSTYKNSNRYGLLTIDFATNSDMSAIDYADAYWEYASEGIEKTTFVIQYRILNNKLTAELYVWINEPWQTYSIGIESDTRRSQPYPYDDEQWMLSQNNLINTGVEYLDVDLSIDKEIKPKVVGHQFTDSYIQKINKFEAYMVYDTEYSFNISSWSTAPSGSSYSFYVDLLNDKILNEDSADVLIYESSAESLNTTSMVLDGETFDGGIRLTLSPSSSGGAATQVSVRGVYKIRKLALDE